MCYIWIAFTPSFQIQEGAFSITCSVIFLGPWAFLRTPLPFYDISVMLESRVSYHIQQRSKGPWGSVSHSGVPSRRPRFFGQVIETPWKEWWGLQKDGQNQSTEIH